MYSRILFPEVETVLATAVDDRYIEFSYIVREMKKAGEERARETGNELLGARHLSSSDVA